MGTLLDRFRGLGGFLWPQRANVQEPPGAQNVRIPLKATMRVVVGRFQGTYECGCPADPLEGPFTCEIHGKPKYYIREEVEVGNVEVTEED